MKGMTRSSSITRKKRVRSSDNESDASERTPLINSQPRGRRPKSPGPPNVMHMDMAGGMPHFYPHMMPGMDHTYAYQRGAPPPRLRAQSDGWAETSDSEAEYRQDPSKRPEDATIQSFLVIAMIVAVLAILTAVKGYHIYHGTEEREENRPKGGYY